MNKLCRLCTTANLHKAYLNNFTLRKVNTIATHNDAKVDKKNENNEKFEINPNYLNRNPRNLEWSGIAHKRQGWHLHYPPKDFYHKVFFDFKSHYLEARVEHFTGKTIIQVKTNDWPFMKHLYSKIDNSAAINLARVLADRCIKYGITSMRFNEELNFEQSTKLQIFHKTLLECGIQFEEPEFVDSAPKIGLDYDEKNFYHEPLNLPFPPKVNRLKKKILDESKK